MDSATGKKCIWPPPVRKSLAVAFLLLLYPYRIPWNREISVNIVMPSQSFPVNTEMTTLWVNLNARGFPRLYKVGNIRVFSILVLDLVYLDELD